MAKQYPFSAYDKYFSLKVSIPMWVAMVFLARPYAIGIISLLNRRDRTGVLNTFYGDPASMGIDMLAALPVVLIIIAWIKRRPDATALVRRIWAHGRSLLLLSTLLNVASVFIPFLWEPDSRLHTPEFVKLVLCAMILHMLINSRRVKDTFADFPPPGAETRKQ